VGDLICGTLVIRQGRAVRLDADDAALPPDMIILPKLVDAHVHLDKCHSVDRLGHTGGDLAAALKAQWDDKVLWTHEDLSRRVRLGLEELLAAGVGAVRSHVDWGNRTGADKRPLAWDVIGGFMAEMRERGLVIQRAALTGITEMADIDFATPVAREVAQSGDVLGAFVQHHDHRRSGIMNMFRLADRFGLSLDFHVDEGLDPDLDGLEMIADIAAETGFQGPILCGHACALASRSADYVARLGEKLAKANISVAVLPTTNLYLQGRVPGGTPDRRGLTRFHELQAQGVNMIVATDNVCDAFCPIGRHDPMYSLSVAVLAGHLDPPLGRHMSTITDNARLGMGLPGLSVDGAAAQDLLIYDCPSLSELIADPTPPKPLLSRLEYADAG
jgi:cytosine deaminase